MSNRKISELPAAITIDPTDLLPIVDVSDSTTKRATVAQIAALAGGTISGTIAATQIAFGAGADAIGGESGLTWDNLLKLVKITESGDFTNLLATGFFSKAAGSGSNEIEVNVSNGSGLPIITALNGATGGVIDLSPGTIRFRAQSAGPAPTPLLIDVDSNVLELGTVEASGIEIGSASAAVTISASLLQLAAAVASEVVINDSGLASNFRVESDANANMLFVDGTNNRVGFGTATPLTALDLASGQFAIPDGTAAAPAIAFRDDLNTGLYSPENDIVGIAVNGTEIARMQQTGAGLTPALLIGTTAPIGAISGSGNISVDSSDPSATSGVVMLAHGPSGTAIQESYRGGQFAGVRTLGTKTSPLQVLTDAGLWNAIGAGYTSAAGYNYGALITFKAEQAYTATASGGRIEFHTTLSGTDGFTTLGSATTERMRITNAGNVGIGTATPIAKLHSVGTNATAGYFFGGSLSGTSATLEAIGDISAGGNLVGQIAARSTLASGTARLLLADTTVCRGQIQALQDTGDTTSGRLEFYTSLSGSRRFGGAFDSAGRFGVGTTAPASIITAQGASTTEWIRISSTAAGAGFADFYSAGTGGFQGPSGGVNTGSGIPFKINTEGVNRATFSGTEVVVNDPGNAYNFRVESVANANMLFVDGSNNRVGIGTGTPSSLLSVGASSQFQVDSSGNLARINDIPYVFPPAQGAAGTILTNDGYGALSWTEGAAQATSAPISTKSSNYTLTTADGTILVNAASGGITITLPAAASAAESIFTIKKKDVTFNIVTVAAAGAELIDGAATYPLSTQYEAIKIQSDGSAWWII